jgi:hypothetical protein
MPKTPPIPPAQRERHDPHPDAEAAVRSGGAPGAARDKAGEEANRRDNLAYERKIQDR